MENEKIDNLIKAVKSIVENGCPTSYQDSEDTLGYCPFCGKVNLGDHNPDCEWKELEKAWKEYSKDSPV